MFVSFDAFAGTPTYANVQLRIEFLCNGIWTNEQSRGDYTIGGLVPVLVQSDVLGPKMRLQIEKQGTASLPFPPIDNVSSVTIVDLLGNGTACLV